MNTRQRAWDVILRGAWLDTVFFDPYCDAGYVRDALVACDGYDERIVVEVAA